MKIFLKLLFLLWITFIGSPIASAAMPDIQANSKTFDIFSGEWLLEGNVRVTSKNWSAKADKVRVHPIKFDVFAIGNVQLIRQDLVIWADQIDFRQSSQIAHLSGDIKIQFGFLTATSTSGTYNAQSRIANLSGSATSPAIFSATPNSSFKANRIEFNLHSLRASFPDPVRFQLYQTSGDGVSGIADSGNYNISTGQATLKNTAYKTLPDGDQTVTPQLIYSID